MAYDDDGNQDDFFSANPPPSGIDPRNANPSAVDANGRTLDPNARSRADASYNPRDEVVTNQRDQYEAFLRNKGGKLYDPSDLDSVNRQVSYAQNAGRNPQDFLDEQAARYDQRRASDGGPQGDVSTQGSIGAGGGQGRGGGWFGANGGSAADGFQPFKPFSEKFSGPSSQDVFADPSYQFRVGEAQKAMERGAAARGSLLTGGTQKAIGRDISDYASQEYGNVYNRKQAEYAQRYGIDRNNQLDAFGMYSQNRQLGQADRGLDQGDWRLRQGDWGLRQGDTQLGMSANRQAFDMSNILDTNKWQRAFDLSEQGLRATDRAANSGNNISDLYTQYGNAQGAGTAVRGGLYGGAVANQGRNILDARMNRPPTPPRV